MTKASQRALAAAVAVAAAAGIWAGPAAGPAAAYVCAFGIETPGAGSVGGSSSVRFTGLFRVKQGSGERMLDVTFTASPGPRPASVSRTGAGVGPTDDRYDVPATGLNLNGRYSAQVRARHPSPGLIVFNCNDSLDSSARETDRTLTVSFRISVQARPPANVRASFMASPRSAAVNWDKSPDPDTAGYSISRKVGSGAVEPMGDVPPETTTWTDNSLPGGEANVIYAVSSSRNGPDPNTTSEPSAAVAAAPLHLPALPPATTTVAGGPGTTVSPGAPVANQGPAGTANPSTTATTKPFALGKSVAGNISPSGPPPLLTFPGGLVNPNVPTSLFQATDSGFQPTLPYRTPAEDGQVQLVGGDGDQALVGGAGRSPNNEDSKPQLAYVAAALLSAVIAGHVLWLRAQVLRAAPATPENAIPLEPIPDFAPPPAGKPLLLIRPGANGP